jgi:hypothetical protein
VVLAESAEAALRPCAAPLFPAPELTYNCGMREAIPVIVPPPQRSELRLSVSLRHILENAGEDKPLTLGLIIESTKERAFGVLMAFLCLPFVQPIPIPGLSIPFGLALCLLGVQLAIRKHRPWLPRRMLQYRLPKNFGTKFIAFVARVFRPLERIVRPRLLFMQNPLSMVVVGAALVVDGILLTVLPAFPGSNFVPAWLALIKILGLTEEDGISLLAGTVLTFAGVTAAILAVVLGWTTLHR